MHDLTRSVSVFVIHSQNIILVNKLTFFLVNLNCLNLTNLSFGLLRRYVCLFVYLPVFFVSIYLVYQILHTENYFRKTKRHNELQWHMRHSMVLHGYFSIEINSKILGHRCQYAIILILITLTCLHVIFAQKNFFLCVLIQKAVETVTVCIHL